MCWALNHQNIIEIAQGHISLSEIYNLKDNLQVRVSVRNKIEFKREGKTNQPKK
jgi:hypothetical protein